MAARAEATEILGKDGGGSIEDGTRVITFDNSRMAATLLFVKCNKSWSIWMKAINHQENKWKITVLMPLEKEIDQEKQKLSGWWAGNPHNAASLHSKHTQECLEGRAHGIQRHVHMPITADYKRMLMLFVVNSNKLHLTVLKSDVKILTQSNLSDKKHLFNSCHVAY